MTALLPNQISLDISKTFERMWHWCLLHKFFKCGISGWVKPPCVEHLFFLSSLQNSSGTHIYSSLMLAKWSAHSIASGNTRLLILRLIFTRVICSPQMVYYCHIRPGTTEPTLSKHNRIQNCLQNLVGEILFSKLQSLFPQKQRCKPVAVSMSIVPNSSLLYSNQFRPLRLENTILLPGSRSTLIAPVSRTYDRLSTQTGFFFHKNYHFMGQTPTCVDTLPWTLQSSSVVIC